MNFIVVMPGSSLPMGALIFVSSYFGILIGRKFTSWRREKIKLMLATQGGISQPTQE